MTTTVHISVLKVSLNVNAETETSSSTPSLPTLSLFSVIVAAAAVFMSVHRPALTRQLNSSAAQQQLPSSW